MVPSNWCIFNGIIFSKGDNFIKFFNWILIQYCSCDKTLMKRHKNHLDSHHIFSWVFLLFIIVVRFSFSYWISFHFTYTLVMFLKIQSIRSSVMVLFWEIAKREFSFALYYNELDFVIVFISNSLYLLYQTRIKINIMKVN